jgi:hypothetical protein
MKGVSLLLLITGAASALVVAYRVEPVKASLSRWTRRGDSVAQVITCNFDTLAYVELFAGATSSGGLYTATVLEGETPIVSSNGIQSRDGSWVRFEHWSSQVAFTRGKQYEFRFARLGSDSIQYYYQSENPYKHGLQVDSNLRDSTPLTRNLAMRIYGRMNAVDSSYWSFVPTVPGPSEPNLRRKWAEKAADADVGAAKFEIRWDVVQPGPLDSFSFGQVDDDLSFLTDIAHCRVFCMLNYCAPSASSRHDMTLDAVPYSSINCAPRGLYDPIDSASNYWARFVGRTVRHLDSAGHSIHVYEMFNEVNDTCSTEPLHGYPHWITGFWRRPNLDYRTGFVGLRGLCSLYVRLCEVAATVIKKTPGHGNDTILIGALARVTDGDSLQGLVSGQMWLRTFYEIGTRGGKVVPFWDGVSVHPYQWQEDFDSTFEANAETLRNIMRGHHVGPLWSTEIGWDTADGSPAAQERNARNLCKTFVTSKASEAWPEGGYDLVCWWLFRESGDGAHPQRCGHFPLLDWTMTRPYMSFFACKQMTHTLTGQRLNGRVKDGDTAVDNRIRMYEFENPTTLRRTWVCWSSGDTKQAIGARLPVWTGNLAAESLTYTSTPPAFSPRVEDDGWLYMKLNSRPVFISEKTAPQRPDLRVDSVRLMQAGSVVRAWVTNRGTRATPVRSETQDPYPTWAVLKTNGDSLAQTVRTTRIAPNQQAEITFDLSQSQLADTALLSVTVNPNQTYVELTTDNNTGYALVPKP